MPPTRRIALAAVVALCAGLTLVVLLQGFSIDPTVKAIEWLAVIATSPTVVFGGAITIGLRLADWREPESEEDFEQVVLRAERLAREGVAAEPDETEFLDLDPYDDDDFEELVRDALDDLPDLLRNLVENHNVAVVISDGGRRRRAYGLYHGDGASRDDVPDRIVIYRDTLRRDFGHDPDLLRDQVTRTVRHELAHHIGFDELGVRDLGRCSVRGAVAAPSCRGVAPSSVRAAVMIVMTPHATEAEVAAVRARLETTGVHVVVMPGELTTAIGAIGDPEGVAELGLEGMSGVDRVVPISRPYKLASSELYHEGPTVLDIAGRRVGGGDTFCLVAGPCTVESREQTLEVARAVQAAGASMLRGGAFKPRTSPFAFKGLGGEALEILAEAREETGLPVVTELLDAQHAEAIAEHADVVQIGARNMQNYALLEVAGKMGKPVLLKRGLSSSLDELLQAADYILKEGNEAVVLCERGIRTFETATRFTLDLGAVPWLKLHTHLPVIVDPSHAAGDRRLVEPLSRAAAAVGADGIIVEVHQDPDAALCDGPQALSRVALRRLRARRRGARGAAGQAASPWR